MIAVSSFSSLAARAANALTEAKLLRSTCHTLIEALALVVSAKIFALASSPLEMVRTPRITFVAPRLRVCWAVARPRPVLAPVMMTVWPLKLPGEGRCKERKGWERTLKMGIVAGSCCFGRMVDASWCILELYTFSTRDSDVSARHIKN